MAVPSVNVSKGSLPLDAMDVRTLMSAPPVNMTVQARRIVSIKMETTSVTAGKICLWEESPCFYTQKR